MKSNLKKLSAIIAALALALSICVTSVAAETYIELYNYKFSKNSDGGLTLCGYSQQTEALVIPDSLIDLPFNAVGGTAFLDRTDLKSVTFPENMKNIYAYSFCGCTSLEQVDFSSTVSFIANGSFQNCSALTTVDLSVTQISAVNSLVFDGCSALKKAVLPETCASIGAYAFGNCPSLEYVYIPASVTSIDSKAFINSTNVVIYGSSGSYAEQYAQEKDIEFVSVDKYKLGDINLDGRVNIKDVTCYQMYIVEMISFSEQQFYLADLNGDGVYNVRDATEIQLIIVNE